MSVSCAVTSLMLAVLTLCCRQCCAFTRPCNAVLRTCGTVSVPSVLWDRHCTGRFSMQFARRKLRCSSRQSSVSVTARRTQTLRMFHVSLRRVTHVNSVHLPDRNIVCMLATCPVRPKWPFHLHGAVPFSYPLTLTAAS